MPEPDYFLLNRMHCNAQNFITSGISHVQVLSMVIRRPSQQRRVVLRHRKTVVGGKCALLSAILVQSSLVLVSNISETKTHHQHQCRVAGGGRCVAPTARPRWMTRLQSSTGELLESCRSRLSIECRVYQGFVSSWNQEDDQPTNRYACRAPCAQEHRSQAGQSVQKPRCDGPSGYRPMA